MLLKEKPILFPQECTGDYLFEGVSAVMTSRFHEVFGEEAPILCFASQYLITETNKQPDSLQVLSYSGIKYWCIADFRKGDKPSDYEGVDKLYITFLLPEDY